MRKRRTRQHVIADLSVHHVEGFLLRCGWTVERMRHDDGIDLLMQTYNVAGEVVRRPGPLSAQSTDALKVSADGTWIPLRLEWRDLLFWLNEAKPVIVILYDAQHDRAYWVSIQDYFRGQEWARRAGAATTVTVQIPMANVLDEAAIRMFARLRDERVRRE